MMLNVEKDKIHKFVNKNKLFVYENVNNKKIKSAVCSIVLEIFVQIRETQ